MAKQVRGGQRRFRFLSTAALACMLITPLLAACGDPSNQTSNSGIQKIKHIIVVMQENRSFDMYFGTYPGADGIPMQKGVTQPMAGQQ